MLNTIISLQNVSVHVNDVTVIKNVNLTINKASIQVIYAPNGSGKSSLLNAIVKRKGYILHGDINIFSLVYADALGSDFFKLSGIFLMPQNIPEIVGVRYIDIFAEALSSRGRAISLKDVEKICLENMNKYDIPTKLLYVDIGFCSSGEKRMMLAIAAVILKPQLCLLDETESGMDEKFKSSLISIITKKDFASLVVTHDKSFINSINPSVIYSIEKGVWNEITI